jgi:RNA polymerase sigma-70 factor (ECF subfamily)
MTRASLPPPAEEPHWVDMLPRLRRYARVLAVQSDAADDLVADTLARARHAQASTPSSPLPVMAIMHRLHERRGSRYRGDAASATTSAAASNAAASGGQGVLDVLWQLPTDEREVLLLVAVECLAYEDVATLLAVPAATVIARLSAARARLRALMQAPANDD